MLPCFVSLEITINGIIRNLSFSSLLLWSHNWVWVFLKLTSGSMFRRPHGVLLAVLLAVLGRSDGVPGIKPELNADRQVTYLFHLLSLGPLISCSISPHPGSTHAVRNNKFSGRGHTCAAQDLLLAELGGTLWDLTKTDQGLN